MTYTWKEIVVRVLEKLGSVGADRRWWLSWVPVLLTMLAGYFGYKFEDADVQQLVTWLSLVVPPTVVMILWTLRAPSGLKRDDEVVVVVQKEDGTLEVNMDDIHEGVVELIAEALQADLKVN